MRSVALIVASILWLTASAVSAQDFTVMLDGAMARWRLATWYLRSDNAALAGVEIAEFGGRWAAFAVRFGAAPPSPYDRDPAWRGTLDQVARLAAQAVEEIEHDKAEDGGRTLAAIGAVLAASRARAGAVGFSDLVERYRVEMERFGELIEGADRTALKIVIAPLVAAVQALAPNAPALHRDSPEFRAIVRQNEIAVATLVAGLDRPVRPGLESEILGLWHVVRATYNLLFMRYG